MEHGEIRNGEMASLISLFIVIRVL